MSAVRSTGGASAPEPVRDDSFLGTEPPQS
jgi:hypothetical protein